jgi:hypothetical protein
MTRVKESPDSRPVTKLVDEARARFKVATEAEAKQRKRESEALRFQVPELQWNDSERAERKGRPTLAISKLAQPQELLTNQMRAADLGVLIAPVSEEADDETADMMQGLYRDVERYSRAEYVRYWAFKRAVACGRGAYRVVTELDPYAEPKTKDQRICLKRIFHQEGVYFDPAAEEPDYRDGRFAFVVSFMTRDEFKREFPKATPPPTKLELDGMKIPEWVRDEDVLVAEYWTKDGNEVKVTKLCGWEELEPSEDWLGSWIPLIPAFATEVIPFDEERRYMGIVEPAMDAQRLYNYAACTLTEDLQVESKAPYVTPFEAIEGFETYWKDANRKNYPYLPYNWKTKGGEPMPAPQRAQVDTSRMSLSLQTLQMADGFIQASTSIYDPSLGRFSEKERSGRALLATQQQAEASTGGYLQNFTNVTMQYEALVVLDLMPKVYKRKGRIVRIVMGDNKKSKRVMVGMPYVVDQQTQRPRPAMPEENDQATTYDLQKGAYEVAISVGKSYQTRLQEGAEFTSSLLEKAPNLLPIIGDLAFQYRVEPGAKEIAKRLEKWGKATVPGIRDDGEQGAPKSPDDLAAENQALKQQLMQAQQQLQQAGMALHTDQAKQQATVAKTQMDNDARIKVAEIQQQTQIIIASMNAKLESISQALDAAREARLEERGQMHEAAQAARDRLHEADQAGQDRAHEALMGAAKVAMAQPQPQMPKAPPAPAGPTPQGAPTDGMGGAI